MASDTKLAKSRLEALLALGSGTVPTYNYVVFDDQLPRIVGVE